MSETHKIRSLEKKLAACNKQLTSLEQTTCPPRVIHSFRRTPVPEFAGYNSEHLNRIVKYLYRCIDEEYNKAYEVSCGKDIPPLRFEIYIDDRSFSLMRSAADYRDLEKDHKTGDVTFRGHKVLVVKTHVNHLRVVRVA